MLVIGYTARPRLVLQTPRAPYYFTRNKSPTTSDLEGVMNISQQKSALNQTKITIHNTNLHKNSCHQQHDFTPDSRNVQLSPAEQRIYLGTYFNSKITRRLDNQNWNTFKTASLYQLNKIMTCNNNLNSRPLAYIYWQQQIIINPTYRRCRSEITLKV